MLASRLLPRSTPAVHGIAMSLSDDDRVGPRAVTDDFEMQEVPRESAASGGGGVRKNFTLGVTEVSVQLVENDGAAAGSLADPLAKPAVEGRDEVPQA